jgi:hypothetical protein
VIFIALLLPLFLLLLVLALGWWEDHAFEGARDPRTRETANRRDDARVH